MKPVIQLYSVLLLFWNIKRFAWRVVCAVVVVVVEVVVGLVGIAIESAILAPTRLQLVLSLHVQIHIKHKKR